MKNELIIDFGNDFGELTKENIGQLFVDIHASIGDSDPLMLKQAMENV